MSTMMVPFRRVFPVFLFRSHATVFFAADIFFRGRKIDIDWDACGRNAPFDIGKELNCVL